MSIKQGFQCLTYCRLKVLKLVNLPTPFSKVNRCLSEMTTDASNAGQFDVVHDIKESEFFIKLGNGK